MINEIKNVLSNKVIDTIKDNFGRIVYEAFKNLLVSGIPPLILNKSKGADLVDYKIYGNSIQNGTPTPDTPIEIESVGERTKNLIVPINPKGYTQITNGITFEVLDDYSIHTYGEPTKDFTAVYMGTVDMSTLVVGQTYRLSGCPVAVGSANSTYSLNAQIRRNGVYVSAINDYGSGSIVWTMKKEYLDCILYPYITIRDTFDLHWYPKFETGNVITEYEPYGYKIPVKASNGAEEITTNIYLNQPLRKIGDYADYIDFENKIVVRKTGKLIYDGTENWGVHPQSNGYLINNTIMPNGEPAMCNMFKNTQSMTPNVLSFRKNYNNLYVYATQNYYPTVEEWKAFLSTNNMVVIGVRVTPIEETIELPNIPTLKGTTILSVDTNIQPSNMEVIYKGKP